MAKILKKEEDYSQMVYGIMRCKTLKENIWRCTIHPSDVKSLKIKSSFWRDVLTSWCEYNYHQNSRVENQILWYNSSIKIGGKIFFWKNCFEKGLIFVYQLYEDMHFKTDQQLYQEFNISIMRANSLKKAIPQEWKDFFSSRPIITFFPVPPWNYDMSIRANTKSLSSRVYRFLSQDAIMIHNKYLKWRIELMQDFCGGLIGFRDQFPRIYSVTNVTKYRSFQYRLLQRGLVTNIQLEKWNILPSNLCSFCKEKEETVSHLLWFCPCVQPIWERIFRLLQEEYAIYNLKITVENILINCIETRRNSIANFLCLIVKQYIYSQRCLKSPLSVPQIVARIGQIENIEKYIASKNNKIHIHNEKWKRRVSVVDGAIEQYAIQYISGE